jgi:hypothetical protein
MSANASATLKARTALITNVCAIMLWRSRGVPRRDNAMALMHGNGMRDRGTCR